MANNRTTGESDDALWRRMADTVTPLRRGRHRAPADDPQKEEPDPEPDPESGPPGKAGEASATGSGDAMRPPGPAPGARRRGPADLDLRGFGGISRADARRIKAGKAAIHASIDLHGMTLHQASRSLSRFIVDAAGRGDRTVLVVTGKGRGGTGVIRQHLPQWLRQDPVDDLVVAYCQAQPRDGGSGAYYVRLRSR